MFSNYKVQDVSNTRQDMSNSVNISIEAPIENQIQEITYDGQEIYQAPLSMSENLTRLAQKIDFSKADEDLIANIKKEGESHTDVKGEEESKEPGYQSSLWPWDSVRNKLKNALTEVCVLADVLTIAKEKRYMVLDPIQPDQLEVRPVIQVYGRKKALGAAAAVLLAGVERLKAGESMRAARNMPDFHIDLLRLRQNWRLKKVSNTIVGDLSYRTAGSKFAQTGVFEVTKASEESIAQQMSMINSGPGGSSTQPSALRVNVRPELQGVAFISVMCQKGIFRNRNAWMDSYNDIDAEQSSLWDDFDSSLPPPEQEEVVSATLNASTLTCPGTLPNDGTDMGWQQKLEAAQNVMFCKELFARLASEAVQLDSSIPHMVVGNQIMATVLPGIQLLIGLCHNNGTTKLEPPKRDNIKSDHDHVLEHSLHQLLRAVHHNNTHHPFPHPATGPLGPSKRRCLAGPMAADNYEILDMTKQQSVLEQILQQAQHFFMRRRTEYVLDTIAKEIKDPLIVSHWNALNSPTQSCVKINIMAYGYDAVCRTSLVVQVSERNLKCICRDGRVRHMSYELQELRDLIYCQIYQHQMVAVQAVARCMGWQLLASCSHLGSGPVEPLGNASSCLLASPNGDRMIAIRCEPSVGMQVHIAQSPRKDYFTSELVKEKKWENLGGGFKEVRLDRMEGKNFLNKMELLMACLSSPS